MHYMAPKDIGSEFKWLGYDFCQKDGVDTMLGQK